MTAENTGAHLQTDTESKAGFEINSSLAQLFADGVEIGSFINTLTGLDGGQISGEEIDDPKITALIEKANASGIDIETLLNAAHGIEDGSIEAL